MRQSVLFVFSTLMISGLLLSSSVCFSSAEDSSLFEISGYILDSNGNGISGAKIIFNSPSVSTGHSDYSGNYVIYAPAGTYTINVWPPFDSNFIYYEQQGFIVDSHTTKNITLDSGHKLSGYISDTSGNPVEGAIVLLNEFLSGHFSNYLGYYFVNVPAGTYNLNVKPRAEYDHFSSYFESNFTINSATTKNITVTDYSPPQYTPPEEKPSPSELPAKWEPLVDPLPHSTSMIWNRTFGGKPYETAESVIETSDGGLAIAGWVWAPSSMMLVKTDKFGNMEWVQAYSLSDFDQATDVIETSDGGYALAGYSRPFDDRGHDFWLVKTDTYGDIEWSQLYGGAGADRPEAIIKTTDGGFALAGYTNSFGAGGYDYWLVKTDKLGNMEWNQTYGGPYGDFARSLIETSDGGFVLCGSKGLDPWDSDVMLIKTDSSGSMKWNQTYQDFSAAICVEASDGGFILAGAGLIVKTDELGNLEWNQTCPVTSFLVKTADGGYALAGGGLLVKTDAKGVITWNQTFTGPQRHSINSLVATSDGGYALAGWYGNHDEPNQADFWVIKTDEYGVIPEFPSWVIMPIFVAITLIVVVYRKRLTKHSRLTNP